MHKNSSKHNSAGFLQTAVRICTLLAAGIITAAGSFLITGCTCLSSADSENSAGGSGGNRISLVSWNVETFFDAHTDGTEYEDFTGPKSKWNEDRYRERLKRLADFMKAEDADIYCFMEIENEAVVLDISNQLQGSDARGTRWNYAAFGKETGGAIGCAVFSKLPLESMTLHQIDYQVSLPVFAFEAREAGTALDPPSMRPLLELRLELSSGPLILFVCHWKSKSGGEAESAVWRNCQEALLASRMKKALGENAAVLACGDFNRGLSEFLWSYQEGCVELRSFTGSVTAGSPWFSSTQQGTYYYHGEWNRLDHVFSAGGTRISSFRAETRSGLVTDEGIPWRYSISTGKGMSDHLPVSCTFTVSAQTAPHL